MVPPGTEPDWVVLRLGSPKTIYSVQKFTGTPICIQIHTSFSGGAADEVRYTHNPGNQITDLAGSPLPTFVKRLPFP